MKKKFLAAVLYLLAFLPATLLAQESNSVPYVGGAPMYPMKNIVENAVNSSAHTTLVAAVKAAGLVDVLAGEGPFTVFAPVNSAFDKLPKGTVETLLKPESKQLLTTVLTYHVVAGRYRYDDLKKLTQNDKGMGYLKTVAGASLWVVRKGEAIMIKDEKGTIATILQTDVMQKNGVIHVIDAVLLPKN